VHHDRYGTVPAPAHSIQKTNQRWLMGLYWNHVQTVPATVHTVKASNFGPHGNFGLFLAGSVASVGESCTKKKNKTEFVDLKYFYNFYSLHFSVGRVSMIANSSEKEVQSFHEVQS
jgi:hypothetical protein